ncbi:tetratricopeptide repeat protein [Pelomonas sp. CA6]|uniref:tetratricopeptide repeat protein n=1 Tax=Pelomonas sp. CA6 TaxID=2907999 RepID=UPI001F4A115E|nr:tetratricopeptide repeat protein [Pelomonas sp. CA6]MCH7342252.1 tetratricopeptide repeat protein [Pelomonas sp. CA6]
MNKLHRSVLALSLALATLSLALPAAAAGPLDEAQSLWLAGKREQALKLTEAALAQDAGNPKLRFSHASMLLELQRLDAAQAQLESLVQDYPDLPDPYNNLAVVHAAHGRYEQARQALERALLLQPDHAQALENMGDVLTRLAQQSYERALKLALGDASSLKLKLQRVTALNQGR